MVKTKHPLDKLPAYAIGTLTESERVEVSIHLRTCAVCRKELAGYEKTVAQMALATPSQKSPDRVKQRLLKQVRQQGGGQMRGWESLFTRPAFAAFGLLLILALTASNVLLWRELQLQRAETPPSALAQTINLDNTGKIDTGIGMLIISEDGLHATLIVEQLPQLSPEQQYQLWLIADGKPASAGVFTVSDEGYFALPVVSPTIFDSYAAFGVSIEPFGGSPAPTGDIVLYEERSA